MLSFIWRQGMSLVVLGGEYCSGKLEDLAPRFEDVIPPNEGRSKRK
jgi:hypothetical protein